MFEAGGEGGVFQHTLAVSCALSDAGYDVVIHTSMTPEINDSRVTFCHCFSWRRQDKRWRPVRITLGFMFKTLPHLAARTGRIVWVQGLFKLPLTALTVGLLRLTRKKVLFSPHNLFSRNASRFETALISLTTRLASVNVIYNFEDELKLSTSEIRVERLPLMMYAPILETDRLDFWVEKLRKSNIQVCSVGQIRADKNLDMLVKACQSAGLGLAIMGQDKGALAGIRNSIDPNGSPILILEGYFPLEDMASLVAVSDALVLPYSISSQSGAAGLAQAYGTTILAFNTGGLSAQADVLVDSLETEAWVEALRNLACRGVGQNDEQGYIPQVHGTDELVAAIERAIG